MNPSDDDMTHPGAHQVTGGELFRLYAFLARAVPGIRLPRRRLQATSQIEATDEFLGQRAMVVLFEHVMRSARTPGLPIDFGADVRCADLGIYGFAIKTAVTLADGLDRAVRFQRLVTTWGRFQLERQEQSVRFIWDRPGPRTLGLRVIGEVVLAEHVAIFRELVSSARPRRIRFMHAAPVDTQSHARHFRAPIEWSADEDSVEWSTENLSRPREVDPALSAFFLREATRRLTTRPAMGLLDEVRSVMMRRLPSGNADLSSVAASLGRTPRTLRRELARQGVHFRDLLEELRRQRARELLDEGVRMTDVALRLGYSEVSALSRAWRRWFGTPRRRR